MQHDINLLKNLTILYAEDDEIIAQSITRVLEYFFGKVLTAKNGIEALELFENNPVNVLLLDYVMPILSGYDVALKVREKCSSIPIIIASAYTDKEKLLRAIPLNLVEYLEKPILYDDLKNIFSKVTKVLLDNNTLFVKLNDKFQYNYINKSLISQQAQEVQLTKNEYEFFELLLKKPNQLVLKSLIEELVYKEAVDENTLRNMVYRLRKKIESNNLIITIKDLGYMLSLPA